MNTKKLLGSIGAVSIIFSMSAALIDVNYFNHGLTNVNGNRVITKHFSYITDSWNDGAKSVASTAEAGEIIDNYLFKTEGDFLIVKDRNSGVVKKVAIPEGIATVKNSPVFTVLKGFDYYSSEAQYKFIYRSRLTLDLNYYTIDNLEDSFSKASEIRLVYSGKFWLWANPHEYHCLSLVRVPSLMRTKDAKYYGNSDFAIAIYDHPNTPGRLYYQVLQYNAWDSDARGINGRYFDYKPHVRYHKEWYKNGCTFEGNLSYIDAVSGTTYIRTDGVYKALLGINCWDNLEGRDRYFVKHSAHFAAMRMAHFDIKYANNKYEIVLTSISDNPLVNYGDTYYEGHYATVATWTADIQGNTAKQFWGFVSPYNRSDLSFYKKGGSEAYFDWSEKVLSKYNVNPFIDVNKDARAKGEGFLVQGMVLGVPPHPELGKDGILKSYVNLSNSVKSSDCYGVETSISNKVTAEAGGCTPVVPFAGAASSGWGKTDMTRDWTTSEIGSQVMLNDSRHNMIVGTFPDWTLKSAVLKGNDGSNVRYANMHQHDKAYVTVTAVMGKDRIFTYIVTDTSNPGKSTTGKDIVLTRGMLPYSASAEGSKETLYSNFEKMLENLKSLADKKVIAKVKNTDNALNSSASGKIWFSEEGGKEIKTSSNYTISTKAKAGVDKIATLSHEFTASITKTNVSTIVKGEQSAFGYDKTPGKDLKENLLIKPVVYKITVSELKANYKDRKGSVDLSFIPDYMWDNSMDYWLMAYEIVGKVHAE